MGGAGRTSSLDSPEREALVIRYGGKTLLELIRDLGDRDERTAGGAVSSICNIGEDAVPELLDDMPIRLRRPGTCVGYDIDGFKGEYRGVDHVLFCYAFSHLSHLLTNIAMQILVRSSLF